MQLLLQPTSLEKPVVHRIPLVQLVPGATAAAFKELFMELQECALWQHLSNVHRARAVPTRTFSQSHHGLARQSLCHTEGYHLVSQKPSLETIFVGDCQQCHYSAATGKCGIYGGILGQESETEKKATPCVLLLLFLSLVLPKKMWFRWGRNHYVDILEMGNVHIWSSKYLCDRMYRKLFGVYVGRLFKTLFPSHPRW